MATGGQGRRSSVDAVADGIERLSLSADRALRARIAGLKLTKTEIARNAELVNTLLSAIVADLNDNTPRSFKWDALGTGSYYDRTKISKPNEFDWMLTCEIRAKPIYTKNDPMSHYCSLELPTRGELWEPQEVVTRDSDGKLFVCPGAFMTWFRDLVTKSVREIRKEHRELRAHNIVIKQRCEWLSPAVTVEIDSISVDIVPAIRLLSWPSCASGWKSKWLDKPSVTDYAACAVAKIHKSESRKADQQCKLWRVSFSEAEKNIILHADETMTDSRDRTCRKDVLRLLKDDLEEYNKRQASDKKALCSYHMKTAWLHYLDTTPSDGLWQTSNVRERYREAVELLLEYIDRREMPHYFVAGVNIIDEKRATAAEWKRIIKHFETSIDE